MVKLNVMDFPVAKGTRSPGWIMRETPVTWPPSAPDAAPAEPKSMLVEMDIPVALPALGAPMLTPDTVTVNAPTTTGAVVVRTTELKPNPLLIDAAKPVSCAEVPLKKPLG